MGTTSSLRSRPITTPYADDSDEDDQDAFAGAFNRDTAPTGLTISAKHPEWRMTAGKYKGKTPAQAQQEAADAFTGIPDAQKQAYQDRQRGRDTAYSGPPVRGPFPGAGSAHALPPSSNSGSGPGGGLRTGGLSSGSGLDWLAANRTSAADLAQMERNVASNGNRSRPAADAFAKAPPPAAPTPPLKPVGSADVATAAPIAPQPGGVNPFATPIARSTLPSPRPAAPVAAVAPPVAPVAGPGLGGRWNPPAMPGAAPAPQPAVASAPAPATPTPSTFAAPSTPSAFAGAPPPSVPTAAPLQPRPAAAPNAAQNLQRNAALPRAVAPVLPQPSLDERQQAATAALKAKAGPQRTAPPVTKEQPLGKWVAGEVNDYMKTPQGSGAKAVSDVLSSPLFPKLSSEEEARRKQDRIATEKKKKDEADRSLRARGF